MHHQRFFIAPTTSLSPPDLKIPGSPQTQTKIPAEFSTFLSLCINLPLITRFSPTEKLSNSCKCIENPKHALVAHDQIQTSQDLHILFTKTYNNFWMSFGWGNFNTFLRLSNSFIFYIWKRRNKKTGGYVQMRALCLVGYVVTYRKNWKGWSKNNGKVFEALIIAFYYPSPGLR